MSLLFSEESTSAKFIGKSEANNSEKLITTISAKKMEEIDGRSRIQIQFYGHCMNQVTTSADDVDNKHHLQHEMEIPSWWKARDFLAALYILTVGDVFWLSQVAETSFPIALTGISRVQNAFDWSPSELEHIIRKYGASVAVHGGDSD
jgi:hypothetical protein